MILSTLFEDEFPKIFVPSKVSFMIIRFPKTKWHLHFEKKKVHRYHEVAFAW